MRHLQSKLILFDNFDTCIIYIHVLDVHDVMPLAGLCIVHVDNNKQNGHPLRKTLLHSAT